MNNARTDDATREVYHLTAIATVSFTGANVVEPLLPLRIVELGASTLELGAIVAAASVTAFLSRIPAGLLCLRVRFKHLISLVLLGEVLAYLMYGLVPSHYLLYPARLLWGVAGAAFMVSTIAAVSNLSKGEKIGWAVGTYLTSYGLATIIGPLTSSILLTSLTYSQVLSVAALFPLSGLALLNLGMGSRKIADTYAGIAQTDERRKRNSEASLSSAISQFVSIVRRRRVALAGLLHFLFSVSITFLDTIFLVYAVTELGLSPSLATLMLAARGVANSLVRVPAGKVSDRVGQRVPFLISFSALALSYALVAFSRDSWVLTLAMIILGASWGARVVLEWTATQDELPAESRPMASAFLPLVWDIAHMTGAVAVGALAMFAPAPFIFLISAGLMVTATLTVLLFWPTRSTEEASTETTLMTSTPHPVALSQRTPSTSLRSRELSQSLGR